MNEIPTSHDPIIIEDNAAYSQVNPEVEHVYDAILPENEPSSYETPQTACDISSNNQADVHAIRCEENPCYS